MAKKHKDESDEIKAGMLSHNPREPKLSLHRDNLLSTGSTVLNLACTNKTSGGLPKGVIAHYVGDSDSGKTVFAMGLFAEAARNKNFDEHDLVLQNPEHGMADREKFLGKKAAARLEETYPEDLEAFYYDIDDRIKSGRPFIMVLDSMDALFPRAWLKKFKKAKNKAEKGEEGAGDFGTQKAKVNSENLRRLTTALPKNGSILVIISQTRDNVGGGPFADKRTVSGGRVLKFYSKIQLWTATYRTIKRTVLGKPRAVGIISKIDVKKNHLTGNKRQALVPILNDLGVDDVGGCIDYLIEEGHWTSKGKEGKGKITAEEFDFEGSREKLIRLIEDGDSERDLRKIVGRVWSQIEEACQSGRKQRYE